MLCTVAISSIEVCTFPRIVSSTYDRLLGLDTTCIFLATRENKSHSKLVKVGKVGYHARLKDLHKSNPFSWGLALNDEQLIPDAWCDLINCLSWFSLITILGYPKKSLTPHCHTQEVVISTVLE